MACGSDDDDGGGGGSSSGSADRQEIDYEAIGLWDDGPCDESRDPLVIGMITVLESPSLSQQPSADALEAGVEAFNARGGANGACIETHICDDHSNPDAAVACVRTIDEAGVQATVADQGTAAQTEVSEAMAAAKIPRVASNVTFQDWGDQNAYPLDAAGTGVTFLMPQGLVAEGVEKVGLVRVDLPEASALKGLIEGLYKDDGVTIDLDVPVPSGTTDYSQFILAGQRAGVGGLFLAIGTQDSIQVMKAGAQLDTDLRIAASLGSLSYDDIADLGDFAEKMIFVWSFPPATFGGAPVYEALRDDLAASGEEDLQVEKLEATAMRSWIGLYTLLRMIRDADMTEFTREGISTMMNEAKDVPMLGLYGDENWTPSLNHDGVWKRAGLNQWATWRWDPDAEGPNGAKGNLVKGTSFSFDDVLCGSPLGAQAPC